MHTLLDLNLAAEFHRVRSAGRPATSRQHRPSERPAEAVVPATTPGVHADGTI